MTKIVIANAFSINMLTQGQMLKFIPITDEGGFNPIDIVNSIINEADGFESIIGHPDTARVVGNMLGREVACNRVSWTWPDNDTLLLVAQLTGPRLPEGATTLPEGAVLKWWAVTPEEIIKD